MKILSVVGARPQFIKSFVVSKELRTDHTEILVHTGQHYDEMLSDVFFAELNIPEPDYNLGVGSDKQGRQTAAMIEGIEEIIETEKPDLVLLYGDTNSTLAGAIAASKLEPKVAHVEAGLRSYNRDMPEEINRVLTDHASDLLFAPSENAVNTLANEGIEDGVHFVGDVMYDAILEMRSIAVDNSNILEKLDIQPDEYVLATVHRAGNTDCMNRLESIIIALGRVSSPVFLPIHPRTEKRLKEYDLWEQVTNTLIVIEPVGYLDFIKLLNNSKLVATDSGGVQKEAFYLETPCVTLRDETEWVETVDGGWNTLVGANEYEIVNAIENYSIPDANSSPYGDGDAAKQITEILKRESS